MTISLPETAHETGGTIIGTVISSAAPRGTSRSS